MKSQTRIGLVATMAAVGWLAANGCGQPTAAEPSSAPAAATAAKPDIRPFKQIGEVTLNAHVFRAAGNGPRPCMIWFFCGGWSGFDATKVYAHCEYLASRGVTGIAAEVRVTGRHKTTAREAILDGRSAIRWARQHAADLGIDPQRIAVGGSSAAGVLSACTALLDGVEGWNDPADPAGISACPNAAILLCSCLDSTRSKHLANLGGPDAALASSPMHHVVAGAPPMLAIHTRDDASVPFDMAVQFSQKMKAAGNRCDLVLWDEGGHGFFGYWDGKNPLFVQTLDQVDRFMASLHWVEGEPTIDRFHDSQGLVEAFLRNKAAKDRN